MKNYSWVLLSLFVLSATELLFARPIEKPLPPPVLKDVSVLIYYSGDNRLSDFMHSSYLRVLREGAGPQVNVAVQYDGSEAHDSFRVAIGAVKGPHGYDETYYSKNVEYDMGKTKTLVDFVKWGKAQFPAKRTVLVISSHGFGILNNPYPENEAKSPLGKLASSIDDSSHSFMKEENLVSELSKALGHEKLDLLVHNSCLMGSLESLSIMASIAKYAIASEYSIYMNTNDDLKNDEARTVLIERIISQVKANPQVSEKEIGQKVIHDFGVNYKNFQAPTDTQETIRFPSTLAFYDLGEIHKLANLYSNIAQEFIQSATKDSAVLRRLFDENLKARYVDSFGYIDLRTLYTHLVKALNRQSVKEKMQTFEQIAHEVVPIEVALYTSQSIPVSHLHVFFPSVLTQANLKPFRKSYSEIKTVQYYRWPQFINFYLDGLEKYQDAYWIEKLAAWDRGQVIVVKPTSTSEEHDDDLFLQLDMVAIRLSHVSGKKQLQEYLKLLETIKRESPVLDKHKNFALGLLSSR